MHCILVTSLFDFCHCDIGTSDDPARTRKKHRLKVSCKDYRYNTGCPRILFDGQTNTPKFSQYPNSNNRHTSHPRHSAPKFRTACPNKSSFAEVLAYQSFVQQVHREEDLDQPAFHGLSTPLMQVWCWGYCQGDPWFVWKVMKICLKQTASAKLSLRCVTPEGRSPVMFVHFRRISNNVSTYCI